MMRPNAMYRTWMIVVFLFLAMAKLNAGDAAPDRPVFAAYLPQSTYLVVQAKNTRILWDDISKTPLGKMIATPEIQAFWEGPSKKLADRINTMPNPPLPGMVQLLFSLTDFEVEVAWYDRENDPADPLGLLISITASEKAGENQLKGIASFLRTGKDVVLNEVMENEKVPDFSGCYLMPGRLLISRKVADLQGMLKRAASQPASDSLLAQEDYKATEKSMGHQRMRLQFRPQSFLQALPKMKQFNAEQMAHIKAVSSILGLDEISSMSMGLGTRGDNLSLETDVLLREGVQTARTPLFVFPAPPISKAGLRIAPRKSPYVNAVHINWSGVYRCLEELIKYFDKDGNAAAMLAKVNGKLGFDLGKDLFGNLGTEVVTTAFEFDTTPAMTWFPATLSSINIRNPAKVSACLEKLSDLITGMRAGGPPTDIQIRKLKWNGHDIYYLKQLFQDPLSFAVVGDRLLISVSINAIKRGIEQLERPDSILDNQDFAETLKRIGGQPVSPDAMPSGFGYSTDESSGTGTLVLMGTGMMLKSYPLVLNYYGKNVVNGKKEFNFEHFIYSPEGNALCDVINDIDLNIWPDEGFFKNYRRSRGMVWNSHARGFHFVTELPFPSVSSSGQGTLLVGTALVGVGAGMMLPVLSRARQSARQVSSLNNMKQLVLSMHIFADVAAHEGKFPTNPHDLFTDYVKDYRIAINPTYPKQDVGYVYLQGLMPEDDTLLLLYEQVPEDAALRGRNIVTAAGMGKFVTAEEFLQLMKDTKEKLKATGRTYKEIPISLEETKKRCGVAPQF